MVMIGKAAVLVDGGARGELLKLAAPICFWGGVDPTTGRITDPKHPNHQDNVSRKILAVPRIVGSCSSSQLLLELLYKRTQPDAIILGEPDAIIAMAVLVSREMGFGTIPILHGALEGMTTGMRVDIMPGGQVRYSGKR